MVSIKNNHIFAIITLVYAALFFIYPHTEYNPADAGIKVQQVKDFIKQDCRTFKAVYNGEELDPEKSYFPLRPYGVYKVNNDMYYTFPYSITLLYTPAYRLLGIYGIILLSTVFGLLTIFMSLKIARLMNISEDTIRLILIFLGCASIIPVYSFMVAEYNLTLFLITCSMYCIILARERRGKAVLYFLAGLLAGISVFFRIELGFFCVLLVLGVIVFKVYEAPERQLAAIFASLAICGVAVILGNYYIYGNIFGLRGIQFMTTSGAEFSLATRLFRLFAAFFFSKEGIGLLVAWPLLAFLFALLIKDIRAEVNSSLMKCLMAVMIVFCIGIPILVATPDGSVIGPRFLAPLQPLMVIITFKILDLSTMKTWKLHIASRVLICYSIAVMAFGMYVLYRFDQISHEVNMNIARHAKNRVIILYDLRLRNSVLSIYQDRIIFLIDPKKDWDTILRKTRDQGIRDFTVLDFAGDKKAIWYPFKASDFEVKDRNFYHGNYRNTIIENIRVTR